MLLFQPEHIQMNIDGRKTETRRLWIKPRARVGSLHQQKTDFTKKHYGYLAIEQVFQEPLLNITEEGANREGGYTREQYLTLWFKINPNSPPNPLVFVIRYHYHGIGKGEDA